MDKLLNVAIGICIGCVTILMVALTFGFVWSLVSLVLVVERIA